MKIKFLGTGSGWGVMIHQKRATGGIWLEMDEEKMIIDPGAGFLCKAKEYGIDPTDLTAVLVSHNHTDHTTDINVAIEAMITGHEGKYGTVLAGHNVLNTSDKYVQSLSKFHEDLPERILEIAPGSEASIGKIKVYGTKTEHYETKCVGFVFEGSKKVGYTSDGMYYPGMGNQFSDCDLLIINNFLPNGNFMPGHMNTEGTIMLAMEAKPKKIVITHFSEQILEVGPTHEAVLIEKQTGIPTTAAEDGMEIEIG